jgi:hypothetical protein
MQPNKLQPDAEGFAVLAERVGNMMDAINGLRSEFRESIAQMVEHKDIAHFVKQGELERQKWEIDQLRRDLSASEARLREEIDRSSVKKLWGSFTGIVSGILSVIALVAVLTGWKPGP